MSEQAERATWVDAWRLYTRPRVLAMLFLGFSAGLPLLLVFGTLSAWLREAGVDRTTIGHISWVALLYGLKFVWAPLVDRLRIPWISGRLGHRRGWILLAQAGVIAGLVLMARSDPQADLEWMVWAALLVAFASATQDIGIDAWRIEAAPADWQGAMAATYQIGYRVGMIVAGAGALYIAEYASWQLAYQTMAVIALVGVATTLVIGEPERRIERDTWRAEERVVAYLQSSTHPPNAWRSVSAWFIGAVVCPFTEFFSRHGRTALLILLFIGLFRISDITMGVMANPFYIDAGYSKADIASVTKIFGVVVTMVGAVLGGVLTLRIGVFRMLFVSALLVALTNLIFAWLATQGPHIAYLVLVISADNLAGGMAGSVFIAFLSGQTNRAYTATQYALFSSLMLLPAKFVGGFAGAVVDAIGYPMFFIYAAGLGLPALLLIVLLARRLKPDGSSTRQDDAKLV